MSNETLQKVFIPVFTEQLKDPSFIEILHTNFPELLPLLSRCNPKDIDWRLEFIKFINADRPRYYYWFEDFVATDHRCDIFIEFYDNWYKGLITPQKKQDSDDNKKVVEEVPLGNTESQFFNPAMVDKGRVLWERLHRYASQWNKDITDARRFLQRFLTEIGCGPCQRHWRILTTETPVVLTSREGFFAWTVEMHNKVNDRLERPRYSLEQAKLDYDFEFAGFFDRIVVLVTSERRKAFFETGLVKGDWPFVRPWLIKAMDPDKLPCPTGWKSGNTNYAQLISHRRAIEEAFLDDVDSLLVIEDKEGLSRTFAVDIRKALSTIPKDWDQLLFTPTSDSYAVRGDKKKELYAKITAGDVSFHDIIHADYDSSLTISEPELFLQPS